ncbi:hypothetical protein DFH09DRAFT_1094872 [Mycena vulgaris]|nr:hypothetical protein DFH09DRAFT_1094872 [Mycena vulgaris]
MSSLSETSLTILASTPPTSSTTNKVLFGVFVLTMAACIVHYASPMRLTRVLVAAIAEAEKTYLEAVEAGVLSKYDVHMGGTLTSLRFKVSHIRETSLRNSLSYRTAFCEFIKGRTLTLLQCIGEVRGVETHIEILKEEQLRDFYPHIGAVTVTLSLIYTIWTKTNPAGENRDPQEVPRGSHKGGADARIHELIRAITQCPMFGCLSLLESPPPTNTTTKVLIGAIVFTSLACIIPSMDNESYDNANFTCTVAINSEFALSLQRVCLGDYAQDVWNGVRSNKIGPNCQYTWSLHCHMRHAITSILYINECSSGGNARFGYGAPPVVCAWWFNPRRENPFDIPRTNLLSASNMRAVAIDSFTLEEYHAVCSANLVQCRSVTIPLDTIVNLESLIWCPSSNEIVDYVELVQLKVNQSLWEILARAFGEIMEDSWIRFKSGDVLNSKTILNRWSATSELWLSQANHILGRLRITSNFDDYETARQDLSFFQQRVGKHNQAFKLADANNLSSVYDQM